MDRLCVLRQVKDRQLTQEEGGQRLELSSRQIRRLLKQIEHGGSQGIKRRKVGGNRTFSDGFKLQVMECAANFIISGWRLLTLPVRESRVKIKNNNKNNIIFERDQKVLHEPL